MHSALPGFSSFPFIRKRRCVPLHTIYQPKPFRLFSFGTSRMLKSISLTCSVTLTKHPQQWKKANCRYKQIKEKVCSRLNQFLKHTEWISNDFCFRQVLLKSILPIVQSWSILLTRSHRSDWSPWFCLYRSGFFSLWSNHGQNAGIWRWASPQRAIYELRWIFKMSSTRKCLFFLDRDQSTIFMTNNYKT